jgi:hypothetical protein
MATVTHDDLFCRLRAMLPGQLTDVLGVIVARSPVGDAWAVAGGPDVSLLVAIDQLLKAAGFAWSGESQPSRTQGPPVHQLPRREYQAAGHARNASLTRQAR